MDAIEKLTDENKIKLTTLFKQFEEGLTQEQIEQNTEKWTSMMLNESERLKWVQLEDDLFEMYKDQNDNVIK